jgi:hypothetical protein
MVRYQQQKLYLEIISLAGFIGGFIYGLWRGSITLFGSDLAAGIVNGILLSLLFGGGVLAIGGFLIWQSVEGKTRKQTFMIVTIIGAGLVIAPLIGIPGGFTKLTAAGGAGLTPEQLVVYALLGAPPQAATGWGYIRVYDGDSGDNISTTNIRFYDENLTFYTTMSNDTVFYLNTSTVCYLNHTGYYPVSIWLEGGTEANPQENRLQMYKIPDENNITMQIIKIDDIYNSSFVATDISDGQHEVTLRFFINSSGSSYGVRRWTPNDTLPVGDCFTRNLSLYSTGCWLGINGSVTNLTRFISAPGGSGTVPMVLYNINVLNVTQLSGLTNMVEILIKLSGFWIGMKGFSLWDILIDDWNSSIIAI